MDKQDNTRLDLANKNKERVDENEFQNCTKLQELFLNGNKLTRLDAKTFKNLRELTKLWLWNNQIKTIDEKAFDNCTNLKELSLSENKLTRIDEKLFQKLVNLSILRLDDNQIDTIAENAFDNCINLRELALNKNKLTKIDGNLFFNLRELTKLWLSDNQIYKIFEKAFDNCINLKEFYLNGNKLTRIDEKLFQKLVNLTILRVDENQIDTIAENAFDNCTYLKILALNENKLTRIDDKLFQKLVNLSILSFGQNKIDTIAENVFDNCINLRELYLFKNNLTRIDDKLFQKLVNLSILRLDDNQIETIVKTAFDNCKNLQELYLNGNKLTRIEGHLFINLRNLTNLYIWNNQIETIDVETFDNCTNLKELYLYGNKLNRIDDKLFQKLVNLSILSLDENQIDTTAEKAFDNCIKLEVLVLYKNKLTRIDGNLFINLKELTRLSLWNNQIDTIGEKAFDNCINLKELYLYDNKLTRIDDKLFQKLVNLSILRLDENEIDTIAENAFDNCINLKELNLNGNKLTRIDDKLFQKLVNLSILRLDRNKLTRIDENMFINLNLLTHLYLQYNQIESIDESSFKNCTNLKELNLNGNKLTHIDCSQLIKLEVLLLSGNQLMNIEKNSFSKLSELKVLDLSNNGIVNDLHLIFDCCQPTVNFNFCLNYFQKVCLEFKSANDVRINISSNEIKCLSDINIVSNDQNTSFKINARFNLIDSIPLNNEIFINQLIQKKIKFDISKNSLNSETIETLKNEKFKEKLIVQFKQTNRFINSINFDFLKERYSFIDGLTDWSDISPLSVITGKNGVGKSTILNYIKDYIHQLYKTIKQSDDQENIIRKSFFIPVVYKMYDKIKPDIINIEELEDLRDDFFGILNQNYINQWNLKNFQEVISIFTVESIDKLILQFKNSITRVNKHLNNFKYKIEINDSSSVCFICRHNSNIKVTNSSTLSPGEQLMLLFRLWEFALTRYDIPHTPVLLLDEPDAHLHPQAVREFVLVLKKLTQAGAQVIMTTHNPTTVSLVEKENLFCMKSNNNDGTVSIEKAKLKTDLIHELTNSFILVNEPYRVVLVEGAPNATYLPEPEYKPNERDALFYQFVHSQLSARSYQNNEIQLVFKSYSGHDDILGLLKSLDKGKMHQDYYAIIDNDNFFDLCSNHSDEIKSYYANRTKRRFNLLRHSLENYILDPINLFVYLNFYSQKNDPDLKVNETRLKTFHDRINEEFQLKVKNYTQINFDQITKIDNIPMSKYEFLQAIVTVLGHNIIKCLTQFIDFEYRIFKQKDVLNNYLTPLFRYADKTNYFTKQGSFCSVSYLESAHAKLAIKLNDQILSILETTLDETNSKRKELEEVNQTVANLYEKSESFKKLEVRKSNLKTLSESFQSVLKSKEFKDWIQVKGIKNQDDLNLTDFIEWINNIKEEPLRKVIEKTNIEELEFYIKTKFQLDKELIADIRKYLTGTVDCCFFENEKQVFQYPRVFYKLRGHYLEEVIYKMFFKGNYNGSKLVNDLLRDDGVMKTCGYLVPNELPEIFKRILQVDTNP